MSSALERFAGAPCTAIQTITCHGRDDYAVWNVEIPSDMFRSIVREAAEKVGTLEELMDSMDPTSGYEMRLLTQMKDGRFAFFTIPERMNALRDYETQGSSTRGDKGADHGGDLHGLGTRRGTRGRTGPLTLSLLFSSVLTAPPAARETAGPACDFPVKARNSRHT